MLASLAADFGVMPSLYEPSGLVREEFFSAGTPLVCSIAGGLRDAVEAYDKELTTGAGVVFSTFTHNSLLTALQKAIHLWKEEDHYASLRRNAHYAACDISLTAGHWLCEIEKLRALREQGCFQDAVHQLTCACTG
jgi:glycogen synthase